VTVQLNMSGVYDDFSAEVIRKNGSCVATKRVAIGTDKQVCYRRSHAFQESLVHHSGVCLIVMKTSVNITCCYDTDSSWPQAPDARSRV